MVTRKSVTFGLLTYKKHSLMKKIFTLIGALSFGFIAMAQTTDISLSDRKVEISDKFEFNRNITKTTSCDQDLIDYTIDRTTGLAAYLWSPGSIEGQIMPYSGVGYVTGMTARILSNSRYNGGTNDGPLQTAVPFEVSVIDILPNGDLGDTLYIESIVQDEADFYQEFTFTDSVPVTRDYMVTLTQNSAQDYIYYQNSATNANGQGEGLAWVYGDIGDGAQWYNFLVDIGDDNDLLMESTIVNLNTSEFTYSGNTLTNENLTFNNLSNVDTTGYHNVAAPIYSWIFGDGGNSTATNPVYAYTTCGMFTVELTVTYESSNGGPVCEDIYQEDIEITSSDSLIMTTTNTSTCGAADGEIDLSLRDSSEEFTVVIDGTPYNSTASQLTVTGLSADAYSFTVILDNSGCEFDQIASINDGGAPVIALASSDVSCLGKLDAWVSVVPQGSDADTIGYTFSWSTGADADSIEVGEGSYSVTGTNGVCVISADIYVADGNELLIELSETTPVSCAGSEDAELLVTSSDGVDISAYIFIWSDSNGLIAGEDAFSLVGVGAETYSVVGDISNECITTSDAIEVTEPVALSIELDNINYIDTDNADIDITVSGGTGVISTSWEGPNGFLSTDEDISVSENGTYTVTITDDNGCTTNTSYEVDVLSLANLAVHNINVYPNPASTIINFDVEDSEAKNVYVFDATGKAIASLDVKNNIVEFNVESLSNGLYFYHITKQDGSLLGSSKFTVAK